jgi:hypothetical protein
VAFGLGLMVFGRMYSSLGLGSAGRAVVSAMMLRFVECALFGDVG